MRIAKYIITPALVADLLGEWNLTNGYMRMGLITVALEDGRHTLARHMKHRPGLFCTGLCADSGGGDDSSAVLTVSSLLFSCSLSCCGDVGASAGKLFEGGGGGGGVVALSKLLLLIGVDDGAGLASVIAIG